MPIQPDQVTQSRMDEHGKEFPSTTKHQQSTIKTNNATPIMAEPNNNHDDQPWEPPVAAENSVDIVSAISASSCGRPDFAISVDLHREPSPQLVLCPAINRMGVPFLYDPSRHEKTVLCCYIQHGIQHDLGFRPSDFPLFKPFSRGEVMKLTINVCFYTSHDKDVDNMCKVLFDVLQGIIYKND